MQWHAPASGKRGRQRTFSDAAIQLCLSIKCLFALALRQSLGLVQRLLCLAELDWKVPDYSTVCRCQKNLQVQLPYRVATCALDRLVDSTGSKFLGQGEWKRKKHGPEYQRQWRKMHLGIGARTLEVGAIEVSDNSVGDAPMLPELRGQIPSDEPIASGSADGAHDTKAWHRLGRRIWKKCSGYHRRSLVETKMHCFKRLGERVMARTFERQVVELHVRVALLKRFTQLGRPATVPVAT